MYQMRKFGWGHYLQTSPIGAFPGYTLLQANCAIGSGRPSRGGKSLSITASITTPHPPSCSSYGFRDIRGPPPLAVDRMTDSSLQLDLFDSQGACTYDFPNDLGIVFPLRSDTVCRDGICPPMSDLPFLLVFRPTNSSLWCCSRSSDKPPAPAVASHADMFVWWFGASEHHTS